MRLNAIWTRGLTEDEVKALKNNLKHSDKELEMVRRLVFTLYAEALKTSASDYDSSGWAYKRANLEGRQSAYEKLLELLDIHGKDRSQSKLKTKALTDDR